MSSPIESIEQVDRFDHVIVGEGKVHWVVDGKPWKPDPDGLSFVLNLRSGMTGRRMSEVVIPGLTRPVYIHTKGGSA